MKKPDRRSQPKQKTIKRWVWEWDDWGLEECFYETKQDAEDWADDFEAHQGHPVRVTISYTPRPRRQK